jgi:hypothetical protein
VTTLKVGTAQEIEQRDQRIDQEQINQRIDQEALAQGHRCALELLNECLYNQTDMQVQSINSTAVY